MPVRAQMITLFARPASWLADGPPWGFCPSVLLVACPAASDADVSASPERKSLRFIRASLLVKKQTQKDNTRAATSYWLLAFSLRGMGTEGMQGDKTAAKK